MLYPRTRVVLAIAVLVFAVLASTNADAQTFSVLHDFLGTNSADGCSPTYSGIVAQGRDGNMYGTTSTGGAPKEVNRGTVFQVTPAGALTVIFSFPADESAGWSPFSGLTLGTDGNFYGTTNFYGPPGGSFFGSVFKITPGRILTYLYIFTGGTDGRFPTAPPIQGTDGNWYGTTQGDFSNPGTVYKLTPSGTFTSLHQFVHGEQPKDPLVLATDGNFYGTTELGGTSAQGSVFKITPSGTFTVIYQFDKTHGLAPYAPLIQGSDGNFYGTTTGGGSGLGGVVFKLTQSGNITVLYNFTQGTSPSVPYAGLVQATDGLLYGTTSQGNSTGGTMNYGTVFRIGASPGTPTFLHDFDITTGRLPQDTLLQHTNGILYGDTFEGGDPASGCGVFYSWSASLKPFASLVFTSGRVGKTIQILGQGFNGTTGVSFHGVGATTFTVVSDTFLTAVVPTGATTGSVVVTTPGGHADEQQKIPRHAADSKFQPSQRPRGNDRDPHGRQSDSDDESQLRRCGGDSLHRELRHAGDRNRTHGSDNRKHRDHDCRGHSEQFDDIHGNRRRLRTRSYERAGFHLVGARLCRERCPFEPEHSLRIRLARLLRSGVGWKVWGCAANARLLDGRHSVV